MNNLLAIFRVPLVRVVNDELIVVSKKEGFPDWSKAVVREGFTATGNMGDKRPGIAVVFTGVELNLGDRKIFRNGAASAEDGTLREVADGLWKDVEEWLVTHSPIVLGVDNLGD